MSLNHRSRLFSHEDPTDPVAEWELPIGADTCSQLRHGLLDWAAYCPNRGKGMPAQARAPLREALGSVRTSACLVIPWSTRHLYGRHYAYTPTRVVAAGEHKIGIWVDDLRGSGVVASLRYRDICASTLLAVARKGKLSLAGKGRDLVFECASTTGKPLSDLTARIRRELLGEPQPVPQCGVAEIPERWRAILRSATTRIERGQPTAAVVASGRAMHRRSGALLALTPYELVLLRTSGSMARPDSVESLVFPRTRVTALDTERGKLRVRSPGAETVAAVPGELLRAAQREFREALPWTPGTDSEPAARPQRDHGRYTADG